MEPEFFEDYAACVQSLQKLLGTENDVAILSGEGMIALWGALKSVLRPGDAVVSVSNGLYGSGIADMARSLGAEVTLIEAEAEAEGEAQGEADPWTRPLPLAAAVAAIHRIKPRLVTAVHCETPSGALNALDGLGPNAHAHGGLLYVDFVSSAAGCPIGVDELGIDLGLLGSQKALSILPDLSMVSISPPAWERIREVKYAGYDALAPFETAVADRFFPYTHNWHAILALRHVLAKLEKETWPAVFARHQECAQLCRQRGLELGLRLYVGSPELSSPTVTAFRVPADMPWPEFDAALRAHSPSLVVGGSYGKLAGNVFRIGHMGEQATLDNVNRAMAVLASVLATASAASKN